MRYRVSIEKSSRAKRFFIELADAKDDTFRWLISTDTLQLTESFKAATKFDTPEAAIEAGKAFFETTQSNLEMFEEGEF